MAVLKIFAILVGLFVAYFVYWNYQDGQAEAAANQFCDSVKIGSAMSSAVAQAQAAGARDRSSSDSNPHLFFFQGPVFNGYLCNLTVARGKVMSRQVTRSRD